MEPSIHAEYIYASGGGSGYGNSFIPFFPSFNSYNGYLFCPLISNIHIFNVGASVKPAKNVTLGLEGYYYLKADSMSSAFVDWRQQDFGGIAGGSSFSGLSGASEIGWEIDGICGYDYSKDVRFQLVYAIFLPDRAVKQMTPYGTSATAHMIRGEVNVKF